ncbi:MAG: hypothetical protein HOQ33_17105 [Cupriavidus sp.]|nr:hypothetical protein [Cupriavidus sp.]
MSATAAQGVRRARRAAFTGAPRRCMYIFPRIWCLPLAAAGARCFCSATDLPSAVLARNLPPWREIDSGIPQWRTSK